MFETDDDDFTPSSSSNLYSIFNKTQSPDDSANLSYKAPRQPKTSDENEPNVAQNVKSDSQSSVVIAKVIRLWKLENGQSQLLGKHIAAIIGNHTLNMYELIIYREKTNILTRQALSETLTFFKYTNNFVGFYDNNNSFWNLCFNNPEDYESFLHELSKQRCIITKTSQSNSETVDAVVPKQEKPAENNNSHDLDDTVSEAKQKTDILTRITKMGRPILPKNIVERKIPTVPSDSETESSYSDLKPLTAPRKFKKPLHVTQEKMYPRPPCNENNFMLSTDLSNTNHILGNNQMMLYPQGMMISQAIPDYNMNNFLITQNTELKNNLTEINMKLNTMLNSQSGGNNPNLEECREAKSRIKCLNLKIENLSTELDRMKKEYCELKKSYNSKCEETTTLNNLKVEIDFMTNKLEEKDKEIDILKFDLKEKQKIMEIQTLKLKNFEDYFEKTENYKSTSSMEIEELRKELEDTYMKLTECEERNREQKTLLESSFKNTASCNNTNGDSSKIIKEIMNEAFSSIMECFDETSSYNYKDIQSIVLKNLKHSSLNLITQLGDINV